MDTRSDNELVRRARDGDKGALGVLFSRHRGLVRALCLRALGDADLAEDAVQEACLLALLNLDRLRRADRFGPWLCGIGLNVCRRWLRDRSKESWSWEAVHGGRAVADPGTWGSPEEMAEIVDVAERGRRTVDAIRR